MNGKEIGRGLRKKSKLDRKLKTGGIKLQSDVVIFKTRNPHQKQLYLTQMFAFFIYLGRLMKFTIALYPNEKRHIQGLAGKTVK
jgi:hypothetical protein